MGWGWADDDFYVPIAERAKYKALAKEVMTPSLEHDIILRYDMIWFVCVWCVVFVLAGHSIIVSSKKNKIKCVADCRHWTLVIVVAVAVMVVVVVIVVVAVVVVVVVVVAVSVTVVVVVIGAAGGSDQ